MVRASDCTVLADLATTAFCSQTVADSRSINYSGLASLEKKLVVKVMDSCYPYFEFGEFNFTSFEIHLSKIIVNLTH